MHIDNDKLVGTYVTDRYSEKGTITIVLSDSDSTPTREYTRYKYVQTEQLTALGIAVKEFGTVIIPDSAIELFENNVVNADDFGVIVKFNGVDYGISVSDLLNLIPGNVVEFEEVTPNMFKGSTFGVQLPPTNSAQAGYVPFVNDNGDGVEYKELPKPRFYYNTKYVSTNVYVIVDDNGVEVKQSDVDWTKGVIIGDEYYTPIEKGTTYVRYISGTDKAFKIRVFTAAPTTEYSTCSAPGTHYYMPTTGSSNYGKILKVNSQYQPEWGDVPTELPTIGDSDAGKVLQVNSGHTGVEWGSIPNELPAIGSGDAGKVLKVNAGETGTEWGAAGGGKLYQHFISMRYGSGGTAISIQFSVVASKSTSFTLTEIGQYCASIGELSISCSGKYGTSGIIGYIRFNTSGTAIQPFYYAGAISDNAITFSSVTGSSYPVSGWTLNSDAVLEIS